MADHMAEGTGTDPLDMEVVPPCSLSSSAQDSPPQIPDCVFSPAVNSTRSSLSPELLADPDALVTKLKECNLEKLHTLCKMHLSFLLDLPGSSLEQFLGSEGPSSGSSGHYSGSSGYHSGSSSLSQGEKHRWFSSKKKKDKYAGRVFGVPLSSDLLAHIQPLFDYLNKPQNLSQEGLFRKSGHIGRQKCLREHIEGTASPVAMTSLESLETELSKGEYSPHDVASLLKSFLGEMPEPLLTEKHYVAHFQVPELASGKRVQAVQLLLQLLPSDNVTLLRSLMSLLHRVVEVDANKMTASTLGTLFAPHILVPRKMTAIELQAVANNITEAVAFMIEHSEEIFQVPETLMRDISSYWEEFDGEVESDSVDGRSLTGSLTNQDTAHSLIDRSSSGGHLYRRRGHSEDIVVNTTVSFADRHASQLAASQTDTQVALAELFAHVSRMPESAKKRKLMKQFTKANGLSTPEKQHKRSKSLGESLKKMVSRGHHKRQGSGNSIQLCNNKPGGVTMATDSSSMLPTATTTSHTATHAPHMRYNLRPCIKPALLPGADTPPSHDAPPPTRMMRLFKTRLRLQQQLSQSRLKHTPVIKPSRLKYDTPSCNSLVGSGVTPGSCASPLLSMLKQSLAQQQDILPSSPKVHIVDMAASDNHSPVPTARPSGTSTEPCTLRAYRRKKASTVDNSSTGPHDNLSNDQENQIQPPIVLSPHPPKPWFRTRSAQLMRHKHNVVTSSSSSSSMVASSGPATPTATEGAKYDRPTAFVSPITRSMNNAPKALKTHMMTPGSRKPMAVIQTP